MVGGGGGERDVFPLSPLWAETALTDYSSRTLRCGRMRRSLFMRMWLYLHLSTNWLPGKFYHFVTFPNEEPPSVSPALRSSRAVTLPPLVFSMQRCHFNEGSELGSLPASGRFALTWLLLRHQILFWSTAYVRLLALLWIPHLLNSRQNKCRGRRLLGSERVWLERGTTLTEIIRVIGRP